MPWTRTTAAPAPDSVAWIRGPRTANSLFCAPFIEELLQRLLRKLRAAVRPLLRALAQRLEERHGAGDGNVEALDHSHHRNLKIPVGEPGRFFRHPAVLVAEDERDLPREVAVVE